MKSGKGMFVFVSNSIGIAAALFSVALFLGVVMPLFVMVCGKLFEWCAVPILNRTLPPW